MKKHLIPIVALLFVAMSLFSACNSIEPERQYPNPGYVQSEEIIPNTLNPLTQIAMTSDLDTITIGTPFRVRAKAIYKSGEIVVIDYKAKYCATQPLIQTNINEFVGNQEGYGWIMGEYSSNGATSRDSIRVVIVSR